MKIDVSQSSSSAHTGRAWNALCAKHFHSVRPAELVRLGDPHTTVSTRAILALLRLRGGRVPLLHQSSRPTWTKTLRRPLKPPWSFSRSPTRSSFTQIPHCSYPPSSTTGWGGPLYRLASESPMCTTRSPIPPPPTPPHQGPSGAVK